MWKENKGRGKAAMEDEGPYGKYSSQSQTATWHDTYIVWPEARKYLSKSLDPHE